MKKVLNVGGYSDQIPLPPQYEGWEIVVLDIDGEHKPDIVMDARYIRTLLPAQFDAIYCSHCLEHFYAHHVKEVLDGFFHVLKEDGWAHVKVPDIRDLMQVVVDQNLDLDFVLYKADLGPVRVVDVIYGWGLQLQRGREAWAHKTGFSRQTLTDAFHASKFKQVFSATTNGEVQAVATKQMATDEMRELFCLRDKA